MITIVKINKFVCKFLRNSFIQNINKFTNLGIGKHLEQF